jgi:hypothetical protein
VARIEVPDRDSGGWVINGTEIARVSSKFGAPGQNRRKPRLRWSVNQVWRLDNGQYAVLQGSYSIVYHTDPTRCRTVGGAFSGQPFPVAELPRDEAGHVSAEPCYTCNAPWPDELAPGEKIRFEVPRQTMDICDTPEDVITILTRHRRHAGSQATGVSQPVRDLLDQCRANDEDFAGAIAQPQEIGQ